MIWLALLLAGYTPPPGQSFLTGAGNLSCASAWSANYYRESYAWTLGFWSGMNNARPSMLGANTDAAGIVAEVQKTCANEPSQLLMQAVANTYVSMARRTGL